MIWSRWTFCGPLLRIRTKRASLRLSCRRGRLTEVSGKGSTRQASLTAIHHHLPVDLLLRAVGEPYRGQLRLACYLRSW